MRDNRIIRNSRNNSDPVTLKLNETVSGFKKGIIGMRVGERRKIYAHPDLVYGKLAQQQLAIFDVEIISN